MNKKKYQSPTLRFAIIEVSSILANSSDKTGATGENMPWAARRSRYDESTWNNYED